MAAERRLWLSLGIGIRDARTSRKWTVAGLADRAHISRAVAYAIEAGNPASTEAAVRLATALGRRLEFELVDPRHRQPQEPMRTVDLVHSGMGEFEAAHFRKLAFGVGIDEPYQHFQFAGRADLVAWDLDQRSLLHLENRTRFPDIQQTAGSFNAKRAYLGAALAERLGIKAWASETHVIVALWSAEVLHSLRLREQTFRALCPDPAEGFATWWRGDLPTRGSRSELVVLDPLAVGRQRVWIGLDEVRGARPRHRGYSDVATKMLAAA